MFMGSSQKMLDLIVKRAAVDYPHLKVVTYSPPYRLSSRMRTTRLSLMPLMLPTQICSGLA